jgi:hypothetical protein
MTDTELGDELGRAIQRLFDLEDRMKRQAKVDWGRIQKSYAEGKVGTIKIRRPVLFKFEQSNA